MTDGIELLALPQCNRRIGGHDSDRTEHRAGWRLAKTGTAGQVIGLNLGQGERPRIESNVIHVCAAVITTICMTPNDWAAGNGDQTGGVVSRANDASVQ